MSIEYIDLVDNDDNVVAKTTREFLDTNDTKNYRVIHILIFSKDNKLIIPIRSDKKNYCPNCYEFSVGGYVQSGEDYEIAAYRELSEELNITNHSLRKIESFSPYKMNISSFSTLFILNYDGPLNINTDEIKSISHISLEELNTLITTSPHKCTSDFVEIMSWYIKNS